MGERIRKVRIKAKPSYDVLPDGNIESVIEIPEEELTKLAIAILGEFYILKIQDYAASNDRNFDRRAPIGMPLERER